MLRTCILCYLHASATHSLLPTCIGYAFFVTYMHRLRILYYLHASATRLLLRAWPLARISGPHLQCPAWYSSPMSKRHFKINEAKTNSESASFSTSKRRITSYSNHGLPHFHKWHPYPLSCSGQKSNPWVYSFSSSTNPQKGPVHSPETHPDSALLFSPSVFQPSRSAVIAGLDFCQEPSSWFPCCLTCPF